MEASTRVAPIYRELELEGYDVVVSHPKKTRYIAEAPACNENMIGSRLSEVLWGGFGSVETLYVMLISLWALYAMSPKASSLFCMRTSLEPRYSPMNKYFSPC